MKKRNLVFCLLGISCLIYTCKVQMFTTADEQASLDKLPVMTAPSTIPLTPKQSQKAFRLPTGYHMELVASEPMIHEPVAIAWDGDAKMYVAQMETYTQDADGTGTNNNISRVMLLEDTNGDGKMDKSSVFIDKLVLPRELLCINHELYVNETNTYDIYSYKDTNGDGVSDVKKAIYVTGKIATGNLEHQRSGLDWNIDNYIYQTVDPVRFKYVNGTLKADSLPSGSNGQWGITHDNYGRLFFSRAGGENAGSGFQINPAYGALEFADAYNEEKFGAVWSSISNQDAQGGLRRLRPDSTLNHVTSANGQSIFRGDRLPANLVGDYIIDEPVARIVRRAKVINRDGKTYLENVYQNKEFISSTDFYFRPVNTFTGPDGNLYIVDMNRGIIQESQWTPKGSYLRGKIEAYGLDKVHQRGRIWRLVHDGYKPGPKPHLLDVPASTLVKYLDHPNGWWRDNAQKQIIILGDKSVVPTLKQIAAGDQATLAKKPSPLGRLHALWTLEGLNAIDKGILAMAMKDTDPQIRRAAIWISEPYIKQNDSQMIASIGELSGDESFDVKTQIVLSLESSKNSLAKDIVNSLIAKNPNNQMLASAKASVDKNEDIKTYGVRLANLAVADRKLVLDGSVIFKSVCSACHGADGKGLPTNAAPPLVGAKHLTSTDKELAIRILLHGLAGPNEGKTYSSEMPAMKGNTDEWIASVLSYARYEFAAPVVGGGPRPAVAVAPTAAGAARPAAGATAGVAPRPAGAIALAGAGGPGGFGRNAVSPVVQISEVKKVRDQYASRNVAWTISELENLTSSLNK